MRGVLGMEGWGSWCHVSRGVWRASSDHHWFLNRDELRCPVYSRLREAFDRKTTTVLLPIHLNYLICLRALGEVVMIKEQETQIQEGYTVYNALENGIEVLEKKNAHE